MNMIQMVPDTALVSGLTGNDEDWGKPENQGPFAMTQYNWVPVQPVSDFSRDF